MQSLSKSDEQKLLDGVKQAVALVDDKGLTPDAALQKVAEDLQYSPGFLKAACNAFNTGRQLAQWNENDSVLDKLASFPLADYDNIHDKMWGKAQEKVAAVSFTQPKFLTYDEQFRQELLNRDLSAFTKAASAEPELSPMAADEQADNRTKRAYAQYEYLNRLAEEARREKTAAASQLEKTVGQLEDYFRKFAHDRLPLAHVQHAAATYYGTTGKALMHHIADQLPNEKRASDYAAAWSGFQLAVDRTQEPYTLIEASIKRAAAYQKAADQLDEAQEKLAEAKKAVAPFSQPRFESSNGSPVILTPSLLPDTGEKEAGTGGLVSGLLGGFGMGAARSMGEHAISQSDKKLNSMLNDLDDPNHLNEMRKIRAQTVLTQLMSDPENPISGYDPEEVLSAYNDMVKLSPRLADQPAAVGPLLNKRLSGNTEPFELGETLKLEQGLKQTQSAPSYSNPATGLMRHETSILS